MVSINPHDFIFLDEWIEHFEDDVEVVPFIENRNVLDIRNIRRNVIVMEVLFRIIQAASLVDHLILHRLVFNV